MLCPVNNFLKFHIVMPVKSGIQCTKKILDSGVRRNDELFMQLVFGTRH
jgi:hypothetical protein